MAEQKIGWLLVCLIGAAFVGEGLALGVATLLALALAQTRPRCVLSTQLFGAFAAPFCAMLIALVLPLVASAPAGIWHGLGRLVLWLVFPLTFFATQRAPEKMVARLEDVFVFSALVAVGFGAFSMLHATDSIESLVRLDGVTGHQGHIPGTSARVMGGFYFHRLKMAHALLVALGCALARCLFADTCASLLTLLLRYAALLILWVALLLTYTRAACGAAIVASALCVAVRFLKYRQTVPAAQPKVKSIYARMLSITSLLLAVGVFASGFLLSDVRTRLATTKDDSAKRVRAVIWREAIDIIVDHPFGVGIGQYPAFVRQGFLRSDPLTVSPRTYPHHTLLGIWSEGGPIAAFAFLTMVSRLGVRAWASARQPDGSQHQKRSACALVFILTAFFGVGLTHDIFFHQSVVIAMFAAVGVLSVRAFR